MNEHSGWTQGIVAQPPAVRNELSTVPGFQKKNEKCGLGPCRHQQNLYSAGDMAALQRCMWRICCSLCPNSRTIVVVDTRRMSWFTVKRASTVRIQAVRLRTGSSKRIYACGLVFCLRSRLSAILDTENEEVRVNDGQCSCLTRALLGCLLVTFTESKCFFHFSNRRCCSPFISCSLAITRLERIADEVSCGKSDEIRVQVDLCSTLPIRHPIGSYC